VGQEPEREQAEEMGREALRTRPLSQTGQEKGGWPPFYWALSVL